MSSQSQRPSQDEEALVLELEPLLIGTWVTVFCSNDPWLKRYSRKRGRVERDDGLIVEVRLPGGDLVSLWRNEVEPVASLPRGRAGRRSPHQLLIQQGVVPGIALQAERRRAGLTQLDIATAMGVSVPRISQIEAGPVRAATATRYLEALSMARASAA
ncbi:MAG: helix-turn-helix domain-containing protein [Candidatus Dormibacteraeota bacterium]|nr:helix-turn-helix domain-containing protein [Candidatus Dormibacteraeota bacterium]